MLQMYCMRSLSKFCIDKSGSNLVIYQHEVQNTLAWWWTPRTSKTAGCHTIIKRRMRAILRTLGVYAEIFEDIC